MGHPALTSLHHLLNTMREWANTSLTGYQEPANHNVAVWNMRRDAQGTASVATHLPSQRVLPTSAHALLAVQDRMGAFGADLLDLCTQAGVLDVGLRSFNVCLTSSTQPFKHLVVLEHSGVRLWATDKGIGPEKAMSYLHTALRLLARVPMDADAPLRSYEVGRYRVAAPEPRAATALHLIQHDQPRLERILTKGPHAAESGARLPVYELITPNAEPLFAGL